MSFGTRMTATARRLIERFGHSATLQGAPVMDSATGIGTRPDALSTTATPPSVSYAYTTGDGAVVMGATTSYVLPDVVPEVGGLLAIGSKSYRITSVRAMNPGASDACYRVEVEG